MDSTHLQYYDIVYKISSLTGMWPFLKPKTRILRVILLTMISVTIIIPEISYQFICRNNIQCTYQVMSAYLLSSLCLMKMYSFQLNIQKMKDLTQRLFIDWQEIRITKEYEIMKSYAKYSRRFSVIYLIYCFMGTLIFLSISFIPYTLNIIRPRNQSRPIIPPYWGYYFVECEEHFFKIFSHALVTWEIVMVALAAHDTLYVTYVEHICSIFAVIGFNLEHLFNNDETEKVLNNHRNNMIHKNVAFCVQKHQEILTRARLLEDIFTVPFIFQLLIVVILMSISLLQITQQDDNYLEAIRYSFYVFGQLIHLFFFCLEGQKLIDHSFQICDKIYHSSWYNVSIQSQKMIIMVMKRSLRPSVVSAGNIFFFSLENFTTILQTSMSYFTVLASFQ